MIQLLNPPISTVSPKLQYFQCSTIGYLSNSCASFLVNSHSYLMFWCVARRTLTISPNQPPILQEHRRDHCQDQQSQQQQHAGSSVAQNNLAASDSTPKNNIEKSLQEQRHQTPREVNCNGGGVVCRCSTEGDSVVRTTSPSDKMPTTTTQGLHNCPVSVCIKTRDDGQNTLLTKSNQVS